MKLLMLYLYLERNVFEIHAIPRTRIPSTGYRMNFKYISFKQGCESRRQKFSSITGPTFRDFGKVSALPRSLTLLGKKVSPGSGPLFGFSRPNPAGNEIPIANR